ncbi:MAG: RNA polymerase sigma factor region1.1 domain-containing protein, partial [Candidatus Andersenbacteria bacterium]|nr:RNA polymerase sigma factor region1.1 domain-containing protein [Candidatus Andersenbacteria bacterium]
MKTKKESKQQKAKSKLKAAKKKAVSKTAVKKIRKKSKISVKKHKTSKKKAVTVSKSKKTAKKTMAKKAVKKKAVKKVQVKKAKKKIAARKTQKKSLKLKATAKKKAGLKAKGVIKKGKKEIKSVDDQIAELISRGKTRGFVTEEEIIHIIPDIENNIEQLEILYEKLEQENIRIESAVEIIDVSENKEDESKKS